MQRPHLHMDGLAHAYKCLARVGVHIGQLTELLVCDCLKCISRWWAQPVNRAAVH